MTNTLEKEKNYLLLIIQQVGLCKDLILSGNMHSQFMEFMVMNPTQISKGYGCGEEPTFLKRLKNMLVMNTISSPSQILLKRKIGNWSKSIGLNKMKIRMLLKDKLLEHSSISNDHVFILIFKLDLICSQSPD